MKTPITYYGGKQNLLPYLLGMIPEHTVYTEPYLGGGALFWAKPTSKIETINDHDGFVVNFYSVVKNRFSELKRLIDASLISRSDHMKAKYIWRNQENYGDVDRAWAFWYTTNWSFSGKMDGGLKYSNEQHSSVPAQLKRKKKEFTDRLVRRIENASIERRDAMWVLNSRNLKNAFHYLDPPYVGADQGHYKGFGEEDLEMLLSWLSDDCEGKFLLSHYDHPLIDSYAAKRKWNVLRIKKRILAANSRSAKTTKIEILVYNYSDSQKKLF